MTSTIDTLPSKTSDVIQEVGPRPTRPRSRGRLAVVAALAVAVCATVAAIAVGVLARDDHAPTETAYRAALAHQAAQYVEGLESRAASIPNSNRAALAHDAERYIEWLESRAASISGGAASTDGFVPGNLPALERQAEQYVEWLEARAASR